MTQKQKTTPVQLPKRISPELAEVLHMLKSLEAQTAQSTTRQVLR